MGDLLRIYLCEQLEPRTAEEIGGATDVSCGGGSHNGLGPVLGCIEQGLPNHTGVPEDAA